MIPVAKILKSNGIEGDLLVGLLDIGIEDIDTTEPVFVVFDGLPVPFFIESIEAKGRTRAIVHLTDIDSLEDAEETVGREILLDAEYEDDGEEDFTGWMLFDGEKLIGTITGIEEIPGNPCLEVAGALIPLHEDFIVSADPQKRILVMNLPEGLLSVLAGK
jgi:16S rRNA processing protein RimM